MVTPRKGRGFSRSATFFVFVEPHDFIKLTQDLDVFHKDNMAKASSNGRPFESVAPTSEVPSEEQERQGQDQTLSPERVKKFSRPGEVERASKEMR